MFCLGKKLLVFLLQHSRQIQKDSAQSGQVKEKVGSEPLQPCRGALSSQQSERRWREGLGDTPSVLILACLESFLEVESVTWSAVALPSHRAPEKEVMLDCLPAEAY